MTRIASRSRSDSSPRPRSALLLATVALGVSAAVHVLAQAPAIPTIEVGTQRATVLAVPDCAPRGNDASLATACRTITDVLRADLRFEDIRLVPDALYHDLPTFNPEALKFDDW